MIEMNYDRPHLIELHDSSKVLLVTYCLKVSMKKLLMTSPTFRSVEVADKSMAHT